MRELPLLFTAEQARRFGFSEAQIRRRVAQRDWVPLRRGTYCTRATRHRMLSDTGLTELVRCTAAMLAVSTPAWASQASARRLYRLPTLAGDPSAVQLTVQPDRRFDRSRRLDGIDILPAHVPEQHRTAHRGLPLLSPARTVIDTARNRELADGLITADAALHVGLTDMQQLRDVVGDCSGWPGIVGSRRVVEHASTKRESPLESRSFAFFIEYDLPLPECQVDVYTQDGRFVGRVDFYWRHLRLVGEADGKVKYLKAFADGPPPEERLWRERLRHDELDDADHGVVRWTNGDLSIRPIATRDRFRRSFERAARRLGR
ncbi:MAG TPA: type IV toxin-antitoxin system AbiEi family antitoxin domain-containing protein [Nocardioidaceae bacterium]|nr:type IV toxin-antitoxin system AbiEi family antitoxin domain-containing protein [Nocardioidaceae bacterium]